MKKSEGVDRMKKSKRLLLKEIGGISNRLQSLNLKIKKRDKLPFNKLMKIPNEQIMLQNFERQKLIKRRRRLLIKL